MRNEAVEEAARSALGMVAFFSFCDIPRRAGQHEKYHKGSRLPVLLVEVTGGLLVHIVMFINVRY